MMGTVAPLDFRLTMYYDVLHRQTFTHVMHTKPIYLKAVSTRLSDSAQKAFYERVATERPEQTPSTVLRHLIHLYTTGSIKLSN